MMYTGVCESEYRNCRRISIINDLQLYKLAIFRIRLRWPQSDMQVDLYFPLPYENHREAGPAADFGRLYRPRVDSTMSRLGVECHAERQPELLDLVFRFRSCRMATSY